MNTVLSIEYGAKSDERSNFSLYGGSGTKRKAKMCLWIGPAFVFTASNDTIDGMALRKRVLRESDLSSPFLIGGTGRVGLEVFGQTDEKTDDVLRQLLTRIE